MRLRLERDEKNVLLNEPDDKDFLLEAIEISAKAAVPVCVFIGKFEVYITAGIKEDFVGRI